MPRVSRTGSQGQGYRLMQQSCTSVPSRRGRGRCGRSGGRDGGGLLPGTLALGPQPLHHARRRAARAELRRHRLHRPGRCGRRTSESLRTGNSTPARRPACAGSGPWDRPPWQAKRYWHSAAVLGQPGRLVAAELLLCRGDWPARESASGGCCPACAPGRRSDRNCTGRRCARWPRPGRTRACRRTSSRPPHPRRQGLVEVADEDPAHVAVDPLVEHADEEPAELTRAGRSGRDGARASRRAPRCTGCRFAAGRRPPSRSLDDGDELHELARRSRAGTGTPAAAGRRCAG